MNIYETETNYAAGQLNDRQTIHVLATDAETAVRKATKIARRADPSRSYDVERLTLIGSEDK